MNNVIEFCRRPLTTVSVDEDGRAYICVLLRDDVTLGRLANVLAAGGLALSNIKQADALVIHDRAARVPV